MPLTSAQSRAARALLDWTQQQLADVSQVGNATIRNFESGKASPQASTLAALQRALETAGVIFVEENGEGPGVRLRKRWEEGDYARAAQHGTVTLNAGTDP